MTDRDTRDEITRLRDQVAYLLMWCDVADHRPPLPRARPGTLHTSTIRGVLDTARADGFERPPGCVYPDGWPSDDLAHDLDDTDRDSDDYATLKRMQRMAQGVDLNHEGAPQ